MKASRLKNALKAEDLDRRSIPRIDIRKSDGIECVVKNDDKIVYCGRPYDISMNSIALHVKSVEAEAFTATDRFEFFLSIPEHGKFVFMATLLVVAQKSDDVVKLAFSFDKPVASGVESGEVNSAGAFRLPGNYAINAFLYKPNFFYERSFVRLESISNEYVSFEIHDLEVLLFPGMKIELFLFDPGYQLPPLIARIQTVERLNRSLRVSASVGKFPQKLSERVAEVLILDLQLSLESVRKLGLPVPKISDGLKFRFIKTHEEYMEVLKLRYKAYALAGKVADGKTHLDMMAPLDSISRILVAYHADKIVSSISISFPDSNDLVLDTEKAFPGGYPKKVPNKVECVEIARLCTDPEYRGSDLLLRMFEHTYRTLQCGGRKYIITSTDKKLWPLYKKLGFWKTGMRYAHPFLAGLVHDVILINVNRAQWGKGIGALRWNYLYRDMNKYLIVRSVFDQMWYHKIWTSIYRTIGFALRIKTKR